MGHRAEESENPQGKDGQCPSQGCLEGRKPWPPCSENVVPKDRHEGSSLNSSSGDRGCHPRLVHLSLILHKHSEEDVILTPIVWGEKMVMRKKGCLIHKTPKLSGRGAIEHS